MRLKIHFTMSGKKQYLPLNYQYPVSAWIYNVLYSADQQFAQKLHDHGYKLENGKTFKLFTFSKLNFPKHTWKIMPNSDRMQVWARNAWLTISFQVPEQTEKFVTGLFKEQKAFIGDKTSGINLEVKSIEALPSIHLSEYDRKPIKLNALSPIVMGLNEENKKHEQYINPIHPEYKSLFLNNLIEKYRATGKNDFNLSDLDFTIIKLQTKTAMQRIKADTAEETKVKGFFYEFELVAPKEIIEVGLNAGFGSMNALGFGYCEVVGDNQNRF